jgi:hypothetical protein
LLRLTLKLFTDGQPNINPAEGHIPALKKYKDRHSDFSPTINTFGFGYNLDSQLLEDLAVEGCGYYSFIPDSSFVGTVFVNSISDLLSTAATQVSLSIEPSDDSKITSLVGSPHADFATWGARIQAGSVKFGQTRDFIVELSDIQQGEYLCGTLKYIDPFTRQTVEVTAEGTARNVDKNALYAQLYRLKFVTAVRKALQDMNQDHAAAAKKHVTDLIEEISNSSVAAEPNIVALLEDLNGQVTEAISRADYFRKWGRHYLPSLTRAHLLQYCNNFKDPGVQVYGGK